MCLGVPMKVVEIKSRDTAVVEMGSSRLEICTVLTPDVRVGDYVVVHAGFSISVLSESEAQDVISTITEREEKARWIE